MRDPVTERNGTASSQDVILRRPGAEGSRH
jgi:hypothetical protein